MYKTGLSQYFFNQFGSWRALSLWGINTGVYLTISGLFASRFLIACGIIVMGCASLIFAFTLSKDDVKQRLLYTLPISIAVLLFFGSVATSFIGSSEWGFAIVRLRLYAALLLMPLIIGFAPSLTHLHFKRYFLYALACAIITGLSVLANYFIHQDEIIRNLSQGKPIPMPIPHIRYGMFVSFVFLGGLLAIIKNWYPKRWAIGVGISTVFLGWFILFLAVRTAWLITLLGLIPISFYYLYQYKKLLWAIPLFLFLGVTIYISYHLIPSIRIKSGYSLYDWKSLLRDQGEDYSDSERIYSLQNGWALWKSNKWLGVGSGDLHKEIEKNGAKYHLPGNQIPHNQFLMTMVCGGLLSLFQFLAALFIIRSPAMHRKKFLINLMLFLYVATFLFEPTFETSIGLISFVFIFTMILLPVYQGRRSSTGRKRLS